MLEDPATHTFLGMTGEEWHAFGYGLKDGIKVWRRTHILYSQIDSLDTSPEVKAALKKKWHYYEIGSDFPEDLLLLAMVIYFGSSNLPGSMAAVAHFFSIL